MHAATHEGSNGVARRGRRSKYSDEQRVKMAEGYRAADDKAAFAADVGINPAQLRGWAIKMLGPDKTGSKPAKPDKTRKPRPVQVESLPRNGSEVVALIAAVDTIRTALAPLPRQVALKLVEYLRQELAKE